MTKWKNMSFSNTQILLDSRVNLSNFYLFADLEIMCFLNIFFWMDFEVTAATSTGIGEAELPSLLGDASVRRPWKLFTCIQRCRYIIRTLRIDSSNHQVITARFQSERRPYADRCVLKHSNGTGLAISMRRWIVSGAHAISLSVAIASHVKVITSKK